MFRNRKLEMKKKILSYLILFVVFFTTLCFWEESLTLTDPGDVGVDMKYVSWINIPWITDYDVLSLGSLMVTVKYLFNRIIEYLPMLILVLLLFACLKLIIDWDWKAWFKRFKYILIWVAIMILSIYALNIISTMVSGYPLINIRVNRLY